MDMDHYDDHIQQLEHVLEEALRRTAREYPEHEDDLYVVGLSVDGQYHKVTVGVSNVTDHVTTVDVDSLYGRSPVSHDDRPLKRYRVYTRNPDLEIVAPSEAEAIERYHEAYESDDESGLVFAEEIAMVAEPPANRLWLRVGPEAILGMNDAQRLRAVQLWELGVGVRIWKDDPLIRYELGDGRTGVLFRGGGDADGVRTGP